MARIFLSHSSADNTEVIALRNWLVDNGWDDLFLDLDPKRGIVAGQRWEEALQKAAHRCEAVIFIVSRAWLNSQWCRDEFTLAHHLGKRLFGVLIEDIPLTDLPGNFTMRWQLASLVKGQERTEIMATVPPENRICKVSFAEHGLTLLREGLKKAGLGAKFFVWPPEYDPNRAPYRGLKPLDVEDAGIFFGRDGPIVEAMDRLRALREAGPPRMLVILGASGSGKSSFMRAGLLPRLQRDDRHFYPLPIVRSEKAVLSHPSTGFVVALEEAFRLAQLPQSRAKIRTAVDAGAEALGAMLLKLVEKIRRPVLDGEAVVTPLLVLPIDQGEELFLTEGKIESEHFLTLLHDLLTTDDLTISTLFTIRSDNYEYLQSASQLEGIHQTTLSLPPMPQGAFSEVITGPAKRLASTERPLDIDEKLVDELLKDIESGGSKDALPLLAFTLERLYLEHGGDRDLHLLEYKQLGGIRGSIETAARQAMEKATGNPDIPRDEKTRLELLRHGLIPWLAGIDPETGAPRRRVARLVEIPVESRLLLDLLVEQRLLATDISNMTGEPTIEPVHEALLRQWDQLQSWLREDTGLLVVLDGIKRAVRDWEANEKRPSWLAHTAERLQVADKLLIRPDLAAVLEPRDLDYLASCREAEQAARARKRRGLALVSILTLMLTGVFICWWKQDWLYQNYHWYVVMKPSVLNSDQEKEAALAPGKLFRECAFGCPEMVVIPAGTFMMGSTENGSYEREHPQHNISIARPFAVAKFEVTFDEWDACVKSGTCNARISANGWGRGQRPVINVTWHDAQAYVQWLSRMTGKPYRLLTESEWEYAARATQSTHFSFGNDATHLGQYGWYADNSDHQTHPVGEKKPNPFGLNDMHGNVYEWVEDCFHDDYIGAPSDDSAWTDGNYCNRRVVRGGSWLYGPRILRSANRDWHVIDAGSDHIGFRVARSFSG